MNKRISLGTLLALSSILFLVVVPSFAAKNPNTPCGYNVTNTIANADGNNTPFQLQSDGKGSYVTETVSRTDGVLSVIQGNSCDWLLDLSNSKSRTVALTLAYPASTISTNPPPPFTGTQNVAARIISICGENTLNNGITYGTMTSVGQIVRCGFHIAFNYNGTTYGLHMNPASLAGTSWVQATCNGVASGQCNSWSIIPVPNTILNNSTNQNTAVGELLLVTNRGRTPIGLYEVAFSITTTNP
ncbi:MAG TPA: hypothetical protein VG028_21940 [Terriglobia bacterium]|nr:hypothetical protein [Terriglobia bacterium]